jgi:hypothetical protein
MILSQKDMKHQKVRFNRDDHLDLNRMPSASMQKNRRALSHGVRAVHFASKAILLLFLVAVFVVGALVAILATTGISNTYFAGLAQSSLQRLAGPETIAQIGDAKLSLDSSGNIAFHANKVRFLTGVSNTKIADIGSVRMGLKALPLLLGKIEFARLEIDDVLVGQSGNSSRYDVLLSSLKRVDGLINPGALPDLVHEFADTLKVQFKARNLGDVAVRNVRFASLQSQSSPLPQIQSFDVTETSTGTIALSGMLSYEKQTLALIGEVHDGGFEATVTGLSFGVPTSAQLGEEPGNTSPVGPNGDFGIKLRGIEVDQAAALQFDVDVSRFDYRNRRGARILGDANIRGVIIQDVEKIEFLPSRVTAGANTGVFTGAIGPAAADVTAEPAYRFEFVSNDTSLSPQESPENRLSVGVRIAGTANPINREILFSQIGVRTLGGQVYGKGSVRFDIGSPEMIFAFTIPEIAVQDAKQLWPSIFAGSARLWVLDHVFGGTLTNSTINVAFGSGSILPYSEGIPTPLPTSDQVSADFTINNTRFDLVGELPAVRDANGRVSVRGANTVVNIDKGTAFLGGSDRVDVANGTLAIPVKAGEPTIAALTIDVSGAASSIAELANTEPINALENAPVSAADLSGTAVARVEASFPLRKVDNGIRRKLNAAVEFKDLSIAKEFSGQKLSDASGTITVSQSSAVFKAKGKLNGVPATLTLVEPLKNSTGKREISAKLILDDAARAKIAPGLKEVLSGPVEINLDSTGANQKLDADLTQATLSLPWAGWFKGAGIPARATFSIEKSQNVTLVRDLEISGKSFSIAGNVEVVGTKLAKAVFSNVSLNRGDKISVEVVNGKDGYNVAVSGSSLDLRALLKRMTGSFEKAAAVTGGVPIRVKGQVASVTGFNGEQLLDVVSSYSGKGSSIRSFTASAKSQNGGNIAIENNSGDGKRAVNIKTSDGGALLRFLDIYDKMQGGAVNVALTTNGDGPLIGEIDARSFTIVGEPRLKSLVGTPVSPDGQSLSKLAKDKIEVSRVKFERGNALIEKGKGYLKLDRGILRSDQIGLSYAGTLYDARGRINMAGTFMPAFGLNRLFSELPIFGDLLGNGRDKGLIGITFKLAGDAKSPELTVNPMSLIAPGIFRQIFEFR